MAVDPPVFPGRVGGGSGGTDTLNPPNQTMATVSYRKHNRSERLLLGLSEGVDSIAAKTAHIFELALAGREIMLMTRGTTMESGNLLRQLFDRLSTRLANHRMLLSRGGGRP